MYWFQDIASAQALARLSSESPHPPCDDGAPHSNPDSMADEGRPVGPVASPARATIGLGQAVALYLGAILGAGVLILPGVTASEAGPAAILSWTFIAILGLPLALTFARLARRSPDAGGVAAFARAAFGDAAGAVSGWWFFIAGSIGQAVVPLTGAYYVSA